MTHVKYANKGLSGLANLGNTCFINSCLQVLSHTYELSDYLNTEKYKTKLNKKHESIMLLEWDRLRLLMEKNMIISPERFVKHVHRIAEIKGQMLLTQFSQNDLPEFLIFLVDCFHNSISRKVSMNIIGDRLDPNNELAMKCFQTIKRMYADDYSEVWNIFYAIHVSNLITLDTNEYISQTPEPYFMIDLPIPPTIQSPTLIECFNAYVVGEILEDVLNETRNTRESVRKQIQFWSFPSILVIDLKRFTSSNRKDQRLVSFPTAELLDLSPFVIGYQPETYKYELYGVCNHSGNVMGGHYTAFIKNANGKWYHMNDTNVSEINCSDIVSTKAYCLFYRKKTVE